MRSLVVLIALTCSGCLLFFDDGGRGGDDDCLVPAGDPRPEALSEPAPLRNPETLTCDSFGGGCRPECGPCPLGEGEPREPQAPIPSWGLCGGTCDALDETACSANAGCRVVKDIRCSIEGNCLTDFLGCFPTDQFVDASVACAEAPDGQTCSRNPACTAFHREGSALRTSPQQLREFVLCMTEGSAPGRCFDQAACDALPPPCPPDSRPGVIDGCWSGACIPVELCEGQPQ